MKTCVLIPTRGDRTKFLNYAKKQLEKQTFQPDEIIIVNDTPKSSDKDITWRYKIGIQRAKEKNCNLIFFWEDDDWYANDYLEWMFNNWKARKFPVIFGVNETYYYHIKLHR